MDYRIAVMVSLILFIGACQSQRTTNDEGAFHVSQPATTNPWTSHAFNNDPEHFQFAIVSDRTGGHRNVVFEEGLDKTNLVQPEFVMSVGDLIEGYSEDTAKIAQQWDEFRQIVARLQMRFFYVPGNHDYSNAVMGEAWAKRFGPSYYHFLYRGVLFLCLNTEDGGQGMISDTQVEYARRTLEENRAARWTLVFMHRPLWSLREDAAGYKQFSKVEQYLSGRKYTVFAGHNHKYEKYNRHDTRYIILATTGGASEMRGTLFGEFDHVAWVTMTDDGPRIANLMLDGIADENIRTHESRLYVEQIVRSFQFKLDSAYLETDTYPGGTSTIEVRNDTPHDAAIEGHFGPSGAIRPVPHAFKVDVPAGASKQIPVEMRVDKPLSSDAIPAIPFEWTATLATGAKTMTFHEHGDFAIARAYKLARRDKPVTIDGKLDEWPEKLAIDVTRPAQVFSNNTWMGPDDARYRFEVAYDDANNVYVAVNVIDERVVASKDKPCWDQDGIEISLDARDDPERAGNRRDYNQPWKSFAYLAFSPARDASQMSVFEPEKVPKEVQFSCAPTASGYSAEVMIPNSVLTKLRGGRGKWAAVRFNISIHDCDEVGGPSASLWWLPDWHSQENVVGSGTFRKP